MSLLQSILDDPEGEKADITKQGAKSTITGAQAAIDELTTGIDFALTVVGEIAGREVAEEIQLAIEYNPMPPFDAGSPDTADAVLVKTLQSKAARRQEERRERVDEAAASLASR